MFETRNIRKKIILTVLVSIAPVLIVSIFLALYVVQKQVISEEINQVSSDLQECSASLQGFTKTARSDLFFVSKLPFTSDLLAARSSGDKPEERRARKEMEQIFVGLAGERFIYDQIRLLDKKGMECVRVNRGSEGVFLVPPDEMQDKSDRYYFSECIGLKSNEFYMSRIDLNQENGMVERPLKPVVRVSVPVCDSAGQPTGVLVINVRAGEALSHDSISGSKLMKDEIRFSFVADDEGYYLYHNRSPEKTWGGSENLNTGEGLNKDFPGILNDVLAGNEVSIRFRNQRCRLFCQTVELFPGTSRKLVVGHGIAVEALFADVYKVGYVFLAVSGFACLFATVGAWFSLRRIFYPLEELAILVCHVRRGDFSVRMKNIEGNDEISKLSRGFNEMADEMENHQQTLETQVGERTRQLEESRRAALSLMQDARHEVAERKKVEEKIRSLSRATEQSPAGILVTDCAGNIEYVNPKFCEVTGYTVQEAIGRNPRILKSEKQSKEYYQTLWETILSGQDWRGQFQNRKKSGDLYWAQASISPIRDEQGNITSFVAVQEDITNQIKAAEDLARAKEDAEAASRAKSDFLANMSHEIRTPMNAVMGMAHLALLTDLTPKQARYLNQINRSAKNLLQIINDILDFSKIEAGKLTIESITFDPRNVLDHVSVMLGGFALDKGLEFLTHLDPDASECLIGDPLRLGQVLINLTNNAIKFTEQGEVIISAEIVKSEAESIHVRFSVQDSGIGLTEEQRTRLFGAFEQADTSTTRKYGGTGLGLSISRQLVEMMGGKLEVESESGCGCTFYFTLAFRRTGQGNIKSFIPDADLRNLKVLLVDDNLAVRNVVSQLLETMTFRVTSVSTGSEAVSSLKEVSVDDPFRLILLDWQLDGDDGLEIAESIHADAAISAATKILIFSGHSGVESAIKNIPWLDGFVMKPVTGSSLFDSVISAFGKGLDDAKSGGRKESTPDTLSASKGASVLLVEDNEINKEVATEFLILAGLNVTTAGNGQEAVDLIKTTDFDLVLMDVQMPVMDGHEATKQIRLWENGRSERVPVPIIAMTAHARTVDQQKSMESGMNGHLTKPIDPDLLYKTQKDWLPEMNISVPLVPHDLTEVSGDFESIHVTGLDMSVGMHYMAGNKDLYLDLLRKFAENNEDGALLIRQDIQNGRKDEARRRAHSFKGIFGSLGAVSLQQAAEELECQLNEEEPFELQLHSFESLFNPFWFSLSQSLATLDQRTVDRGPAATGSDAELLSLLNQMKDPLNEGRPVDLQRIAKNIQSKEWAVQWQKPIHQMMNHLSKYRFDLIQPLLIKLIEDLSAQ